MAVELAGTFSARLEFSGNAGREAGGVVHRNDLLGVPYKPSRYC
jgi:hypothetical protein